jgi:hypothetical protein
MARLRLLKVLVMILWAAAAYALWAFAGEYFAPVCMPRPRRKFQLFEVGMLDD